MKYPSLFFTLILTGASGFNSYSGDTGPKYGTDSVTCVQNLSVYVEFVKQKNFDDAYPPWKWVFDNCPKSSKKMYVDGLKILENQFRKEKAAARKEVLIDTIMLLYDKRIMYFGEEGFVLGRKGVDLYQYRKLKVEEVVQILQKSVELQGNKSEAGAVVVYVQAAAELVKAGKFSKEKLLEIYDRVSTIIDYNISNTIENRQYFEPAKSNVDAFVTPFAECADLIAIYSPKVKQNKQDTVLLRKVVKFLSMKNCTSSPLYAEAAEALYALEPSAFSAFNLGKLFIEKNQNAKAANFLQQAVDLEQDNVRRGEYLLELANHYFHSMNQYEQARTYALRAASVPATAGKAYLIIGDIYVSSAKNCGTNDFEVNAVYWVAVDKYAQAKNADASVAEDANRKIATYSQYFPKKSDAFFYNYTADQDYKVGCWINENTKVRVQ